MNVSFENDPNIAQLKEQLGDSSKPEVIAIWGASGSGKSTLARFLSQGLENSAVFPIDRYLSPNLKSATYDHDTANPLIPHIEGLDPNIWDQELLNKHLSRIALMQSIDMPVFDHKARKRVGYEAFSPSIITIVEGAYAFENSIEQIISKRILIKAPFHDRFIRKLVRTSHTNKRTDLDESISRYIQRTEPAAEFYYQKYTPISDFTIDNPSDPIVEFRDIVAEEIEEDTSGRRYFQPLDESTHLKYGESLSVEELSSSEYVLRYSLDRQVILKAKIGNEVVALLSRHYTTM